MVTSKYKFTFWLRFVVVAIVSLPSIICGFFVFYRMITEKNTLPSGFEFMGIFLILFGVLLLWYMGHFLRNVVVDDTGLSYRNIFRSKVKHIKPDEVEYYVLRQVIKSYRPYYTRVEGFELCLIKDNSIVYSFRSVVYRNFKEMVLDLPWTFKGLYQPGCFQEGLEELGITKRIKENRIISPVDLKDLLDNYSNKLYPYRQKNFI